MRVLVFTSLITLAAAAPYDQLPGRPASLAEWGKALTKFGSWLEGFSPAPQSILEPAMSSGDNSKSIYDILKDDKQYSRLVKILEANDEIVRRLKDEDVMLTMFAPNNDAFPHHDQFEREFAARFGGNDDKKRDEALKRWFYDISLYHMLPEDLNESRLSRNSTIATQLRTVDGSLGGKRQRAKFESHLIPPKVVINTYATVTKSDIRAKNGIIHQIDGVLVPPGDIMQHLFFYPAKFSISASAILKVELEDELEFWGDNRNWRHKNDHGSKGRTRGGDGEKGHFKGYPASTFFLPTNDAWNKLPEDLVRVLFSEMGENALRKIMQFHIVPDYVLFTEFVREVKSEGKNRQEHLHINDNEDLGFELDQQFPTVVGQDIPVHIKKTQSMIPGSNQYNWEFKVHGIDVQTYDIPAMNGALHVLDSVICPRHDVGRDQNQNNDDWNDWQEWIRKWSQGK